MSSLTENVLYRSKSLYTLSLAYFSIVQLYLLTLSFYLVAQALTLENLNFDFKHGIGGLLSGFIGSTGGIVLVALVSTYGIYFIASLLYADPWHMLTSSWAYFLGMPSSINVLMVYAFCNWHDVSWGTKGADKPDKLPSAQTKKDAEAPFVEELDKPQIDIDEQFAATVKRALEPWQEPEENEGSTLDDSYKAFRTNLVLLWTFSNGLLALCINNTSIQRLCLSVRIPRFCILQVRVRICSRLTKNTEYIDDTHGVVLQMHSLGHVRTLHFPVSRGVVFPCKDGCFVLRFSTMI